MSTQYSRYSKWVGTVGLMGFCAASFAGDVQPDVKTRPPQEPAGFVAGAVIGAFAAGPIGAVVGAGLGGWLGNRVHRASDAKKAEAQVALLESDKSQLQSEKGVLLSEKGQLTESNQALSAKLDDLSQKIKTAQAARDDASEVLDGLQGDVLFRTGSSEITADIAHQIQVLAQAVSKSPELKIRVDGYADPRGTNETNLKLSQERANAVRDLLLASGVSDAALEINAYGKSQSTAEDSDGYALERRVRLTLQMDSGAAVAQVNQNE
ncbi:MAG TPA: OmpA family protein [Steroidobacteraceae bacterium]|jgi:outer membrane protein OmpA-like peptidoglycan-associated protein|nr:OmpA family protein [Steroidobacteraceae bacterium]